VPVLGMTWIPDASSVRTFRESPELFRLRYRQHLVPAGREEAPDSGTAMHAALNVWFQKAESDLDAAMTALRDAWGEEPLFHTGLKRPLSLFERLLETYAEVWPRERDPFTVVANEEYLEAQIVPRLGKPLVQKVNPPRSTPIHSAVNIDAVDEVMRYPVNVQGFRYCGIRDRVIEFPDGSRYICDLKTTSAWLKGNYFELFRVGEQMSGYLALELALGRRCDGYYIDAIHVDTRSHAVKADRDFVRHGPVKLPAWQLDRWARDMEWTLKQIELLDREVGPDEPWPVYANFPYGNTGTYWQFLVEPPELHDRLMLEFVREPWEPKARVNG